MMMMTKTPSRTVPVEDRAWQYISRMPPSIQGEGGSAALFRVAVVLVRGFNLPPDAASPLLEHWNRAYSRPVWTDGPAPQAAGCRPQRSHAVWPPAAGG